MSNKSAVEIAKKYLINFPESVDSQLWNDRMDKLLAQLEEFERQVNESKTSKG